MVFKNDSPQKKFVWGNKFQKRLLENIAVIVNPEKPRFWAKNQFLPQKPPRSWKWIINVIVRGIPETLFVYFNLRVSEKKKNNVMLCCAG